MKESHSPQWPRFFGLFLILYQTKKCSMCIAWDFDLPQVAISEACRPLVSEYGNSPSTVPIAHRVIWQIKSDAFAFP